ncbi:MAG: SRPBCC family protein [Solirubrobacterales bacterium]
MAKTRKEDKGAVAYGREALKHWGSAARYGFDALASKRRSRAETNGGASGDGSLAAAELPIQASIDVAIPVSAAFALCTQYGDFPEFLDRVESVEVDGRDLEVIAKIGGAVRELAIEVMDERTDERLDWECAEGYEHSGVVSLHPLAPRLTRLELTIERQPEGLGERFTRRVGLTQRTIEEELRRFKAYAELWEEAEEFEDADSQVPEEEHEEEEGEEEPVDEQVEKGV